MNVPFAVIYSAIKTSAIVYRCSGRVKKAIPESDRMGHYGSGKKGQSEEKGHYYGS